VLEAPPLVEEEEVGHGLGLKTNRGCVSLATNGGRPTSRRGITCAARNSKAVAAEVDITAKSRKGTSMRKLAVLENKIERQLDTKRNPETTSGTAISYQANFPVAHAAQSCFSSRKRLSQTPDMTPFSGVSQG
jgi:hypothetical protein